MADSLDLVKEFEDTEQKRSDLIAKALDKRKKADSLGEQIKKLAIQKAEADRQAAAADRSLDTHFKCMFAGCVLAAMGKGAVSPTVVTEIVNVLSKGIRKEKDRIALKERYKGLEGLAEKFEKPTSPAVVKCKCGETMIQKTASQGDNAGKSYLSCPSSTQETKAQHDFKWL